MARVVGDDLDDLIGVLRKKVDGVGKFIDGFVQERGGFLILGAIKRRLWNKGIDGQGNILQPYSPGYKRKKQRAGVRSSPTTLKLTGKWYDSMLLQSRAESTGEIKVLSSDAKNTLLVEKYGEDILTLTQKEQMLFIMELEKELIKHFDIKDIKFDFR